MAQQSFAAHTGTLNAPRAVATLLQQGALADHGGVLSVTPLGRVASQALLPVPVVAAVRALPQDPTVLDVLLAAAAHVRLPSLGDESRATLVDALMSVPSRTLDAGTAPPDAVIGAALLHATTHHGDDGAAELSGLHEPTLTALREETLRIVSAWHALSPSISVNLTRVSLAAQLPPPRRDARAAQRGRAGHRPRTQRRRRPGSPHARPHAPRPAHRRRIHAPHRRTADPGCPGVRPAHPERTHPRAPRPDGPRGPGPARPRPPLDDHPHGTRLDGHRRETSTHRHPPGRGLQMRLPGWRAAVQTPLGRGIAPGVIDVTSSQHWPTPGVWARTGACLPL